MEYFIFLKKLTLKYLWITGGEKLKNRKKALGKEKGIGKGTGKGKELQQQRQPEGTT